MLAMFSRFFFSLAVVVGASNACGWLGLDPFSREQTWCKMSDLLDRGKGGDHCCLGWGVVAIVLQGGIVWAVNIRFDPLEVLLILLGIAHLKDWLVFFREVARKKKTGGVLTNLNTFQDIWGVPNAETSWCFENTKVIATPCIFLGVRCSWLMTDSSNFNSYLIKRGKKRLRHIYLEKMGSFGEKGNVYFYFLGNFFWNCFNCHFVKIDVASVPLSFSLINLYNTEWNTS